MVFENRADAGRELAKELKGLNLNLKNAVSVGIARGGAIIAFEISNKLGIPFEVIVVKKLGAPQDPELAIGAVGAFGKPVLDRWLISDLKVSGDYLKKEIATKSREAKNKSKEFAIESIKSKFREKLVILSDDGLATGQTAIAAGKIVRSLGAKEVILAVACAAPSTIEGIRDFFDRVVCPVVSEEFMAVGQFYKEFDPVSDAEVKYMLERSKRDGG